MYNLTIIVDFEAAHRIVDYPGKCNRLHGHNWRVEVNVKGHKLNELGMLIDFRELKQEVGAVVDRLDHVYLNEQEPFTSLNPTAENIARYIYDELVVELAQHDNIAVESVRIWESPKSAVTYSAGEPGDK